MIKENISKNISDYGFLRLLVSTMTVKNQLSIFENMELQQCLFKFYNNPQFHFLFEDVAIKEDKIYTENSYVDLSSAFQMAYITGLLTNITGSSKLKSSINLSHREAEKMLHDSFSIEQIQAMSSLCYLIDKTKSITVNNNNNKKLLKSIN